MSNDAVPTLVKDYSSSNLSPETKKKIEAVLVCYDINLKANTSQLENWQSFNFSNWNAAVEIKKVEEQLGKYRILEDNETSPIEIISPDGAEFTCPRVRFGFIKGRATVGLN